ncbi:MAG: hypothetical protein QOH57_3681, partial [Mycobacterium sp.]|nr:hypothetical protein [Mycobacterium sp.]
MLVDTGLLGTAASAEATGTATMASATAAAAPEISAVLPPGSDSVSMRAAAVLSARGAETM